MAWGCCTAVAKEVEAYTRLPIKKSESLDEFEYDLGLRSHLKSDEAMQSPWTTIRALLSVLDGSKFLFGALVFDFVSKL